MFEGSASMKLSILKQLKVAAIILLAVLMCYFAAFADVDTKSLAGDMLQELLRHQTVPFEQSALNGFYPRTSIVAGAGEKIANKLIEENGNRLGFMLTESAQPSGVSDNPYVDITKGKTAGGKSPEMILAEKIQSSSGNLTPDQVLGMAIDSCGGDYWLATLTAHNLLKEVAYASRLNQQPVIGWDAANPGDVNSWQMLRTDSIISKLSNLRPSGDAHASDVIGPWYHMYGLFFVGGMTSGSEADFLAWAENVTRWLGLGSSSDPFKEDMNTWAANLTHAMNEMVDSGAYAPPDLSMFSKEELQTMFDKLRAEHKELQKELETLAPMVNHPNMGRSAEWRMDVVRDLQRALYEEALRVREEMNSRP